MDERQIVGVFNFVGLLVVLDQLSKWFFTNKSFFTNWFLSINYGENFGSAFNVFSSFEYYQLFLGFGSMIVMCILVYKFSWFVGKGLKWPFVFVMAGIMGNTIDRLWFGYVRDFIALDGLFVFNAADAFLSVGFLLFAWWEFNRRHVTKKGKLVWWKKSRN